MTKFSFEEMANALTQVGIPPENATEEQDLAWNLECDLALELGSWENDEFWDEYYIRKAQDQIEELVN